MPIENININQHEESIQKSVGITCAGLELRSLADNLTMLLNEKNCTDNNHMLDGVIQINNYKSNQNTKRLMHVAFTCELHNNEKKTELYRYNLNDINSICYSAQWYSKPSSSQAKLLLQTTHIDDIIKNIDIVQKKISSSDSNVPYKHAYAQLIQKHKLTLCKELDKNSYIEHNNTGLMTSISKAFLRTAACYNNAITYETVKIKENQINYDILPHIMLKIHKIAKNLCSKSIFKYIVAPIISVINIVFSVSIFAIQKTLLLIYKLFFISFASIGLAFTIIANIILPSIYNYLVSLNNSIFNIIQNK